MKSKFFRYFFGAVLAMIFLGGCDDKEAGFPSNMYQQYQVLVENGGASAFANFREGGDTGPRVYIGENSLTVNMLPMYYQESVSETVPEFNYFGTLAVNHTKAIFRFKNSSGKTLVNTIEYGDLEEIYPSVTGLYEVNGGQKIELTLKEAKATEVKAYLVSTDALSTTIALPVVAGPGFSPTTAEITLPELTGLYDLIIDRVVSTPVTAGDGNASGIMTVVVRSRRPLKFT